MKIQLQVKKNIMHYLCDDWNNHKRGKAHKENQALFDKVTNEAIWNGIDLEMVMDKVVEGIYSTDFKAYEEQIRADAVDKFVKALEEHQQKNWVDNLEYGITFADIEEVAEQLKEKK